MQHYRKIKKSNFVFAGKTIKRQQPVKQRLAVISADKKRIIMKPQLNLTLFQDTSIIRHDPFDKLTPFAKKSSIQFFHCLQFFFSISFATGECYLDVF